MKPNKLQGKVVLITGASSGVGEALSHCFYSCGCKVILAARRETELQRVKYDLLSKKLGITTHEPIILQLDLSHIESVKEAVEKVLKLCGHIDILINNGGISSRGSVLNTNMDVQRQLMTVNYFGAVALTKDILPSMIEKKSGSIIFVSSVQGKIALPERSAYSASKHACQAFADSLRAEVSKYKIHVGVCSPGYIQTALSLNALTESGTKHGVMDPTTAAGYRPEYVANKILEMVLTRNNEMILSTIGPRLAILLRYLIPSLYFWIMSKRAK